MMNKYQVIFQALKKKVGPDAARMISYNVYDEDSKKQYPKVNSITEKTIRNTVGACFIPYMCLYIEERRQVKHMMADWCDFPCHPNGGYHSYYMDRFQENIDDIYEHSYKPNIVSRVWEE